MCSHFLSYSAHFKLNVFVIVICTYALRLKIYMFISNDQHQEIIYYLYT